jgi:hypothetical protein
VKRFKKEANPKKEKLSVVFCLVGNFALLLWMGIGCKTTKGIESPQMPVVIGLTGNARYSDGQSDAWHALKAGDKIPPGSIIQTADGVGNAVALTMGEQTRLRNPVTPHAYDHSIKLILYENTVLKFGKITLKTVGARQISDVRLLLVAGSALCNVGMAWPMDNTGLYSPTTPDPKIETTKPQPESSYYEIRSSNTVVHAEHAVFYFAASGITRSLRGTVALALTDSGSKKDLLPLQQYDPLTGDITQIDTSIPTEFPCPPVWGRFWPKKKNAYWYEVPRRPF